MHCPAEEAEGMAEVACPECGAKISDLIYFCPHCGFNADRVRNPYVPLVITNLVLGALVFGCAGVVNPKFWIASFVCLLLGIVIRVLDRPLRDSVPPRHPMPDGFARMAARPPTAEEINIFDSLDERCAVEHFLGKNLEQAQALFRENFLRYQEDLMWMGPIAFRFYVPAAINYLASKDADHNADAASSFCALIEFRLDNDAAEIAPVRSIIREGILEILGDFDRYECDRDIHSNVDERYRALIRRLSP
jgi:hypothetical protein